MIKRLLPILLVLCCAGCDWPIRHLGPAEYGVIFRSLPPLFGGGMARKIRRPGETFVVMPWDKLYVFDTKIQNLEWGRTGDGTNPALADYVRTRALDGNEVSLSVKVQYEISTAEERLLYLVQNVATSNRAIEDVVIAAARADLRTAMNSLKTSEFFNNTAKYQGEADAKKALQERLGKFGIDIVSVNLSEHRFERQLTDGKVDHTYQDRINRIQALEQETAREMLNKDAVIADKEREFNNAQAEVNSIVAAANGYRSQSQLRGDGYLAARKNEAEGVLAAGKAQVEGLVAQVNALSGPGGRALLKLDLSKYLQQGKPRFVLMGESSGNQGIDVNRVDTNQLLNQIGLFEGLQCSKDGGAVSGDVKGK